MFDFSEIENFDPELSSAISLEIKRQEDNIELIASENFVSKAVMSAVGSPLTNKYAEGYSGKRYYGGCQYVDVAENLAIERAKELFNASFANVQPHSGAQANFAVFFALLNPGDKVLGMNLAHGGHLTHGSPVNFSGKYYDIIPYGVSKETELIDYDELHKIALETKPKIIIAGASAYSRIIDFERISKTAKEIGAYFMVDMAHIAGLVATGHHPSPLPFADVVTTTTHKTLRGPRGGLILTNSEEMAKLIDKSIFPGIQGGPLMHVIAGKAIAFKEALQDDFKQYSGQIIKNAHALSNALAEKGFTIVSGGTDNHLVLINLLNMDITGKDAEKRLDEIHITCNKNAIPFDPKSPFITSGIRLGTPAMTTRGLVESDMVEIADIISDAIKDFDATKEKSIQRVNAIVKKYPLFKK